MGNDCIQAQNTASEIQIWHTTNNLNADCGNSIFAIEMISVYTGNDFYGNIFFRKILYVTNKKESLKDFQK